VTQTTQSVPSTEFRGGSFGWIIQKYLDAMGVVRQNSGRFEINETAATVLL
jgi:hypothetical protein